MGTATRTATAEPEAEIALLAVARRGNAHVLVRLRRGRRLAPRVLEQGPGAVHACVLPTHAGPLAGDRDRLRISVGERATLVVRPIAATLALPGPARTRLELDIDVAAGGRLVLEDAPLIVTAGAGVQRTTTVRLGPGAAAALRDVVVLGRAGEPAGGRLDSALRITDDEGEILHDAMRLHSQLPAPHVALAPGHRAVGTLVVAGREAAAALAEPHFALARCGALRRASARELADVDAALGEPWARWSASLAR